MNTQISTLNILKGLACIGVIFIHVNFPGLFGSVVERLSRFAVPCFFMIAGYFAYQKNELVVRRRLFKILKILFVGSILYFFQNCFSYFSQGMLGNFFAIFFHWKTLLNAFVFCSFLAPVLWYLIAQAEIYVVWYFVVKRKKENVAIYCIPLLFVLMILLNVYCDTLKMSWVFHTNFITEAMPFFLFGFYLHSKESFFKSIHYSVLLFILFAGGGAALVPKILDTSINFSCIGVIFYSLSIFIIAIKIPNKSYCKPLEYVGENLSLNIYLFHMLVYSVLNLFCNHFFYVDVRQGTLGYLFPIVMVLLSIIVAYSVFKLTTFFQCKKNIECKLENRIR